MSLIKGKQLENDTVSKEKLKLTMPVIGKDPVTKEFFDNRKINGKNLSSDITLDKSDIGLSNVDNTLDIDKPISLLQKIAIDEKLTYNTISEFRSSFNTNVNSVQITDINKAGLFKYDPTDTTSSDDGVLVLVKDNKRYKRQYENYVNVKWFDIIGDVAENTHVSGAGGLPISNNETSKWQALLDNPNIKSIYFPKTRFPYRINRLFITQSNKELIFESGCVIKGLNIQDGAMFTIRASKNITIKGNNSTFSDSIDAYRVNTVPGQPDNDLQFRGWMLLLGAENITFNGLNINTFAGDAIGMWKNTINDVNRNISVTDFHIDGVARNGISIQNVDGLWITNSSAANIRTAAPMNGLDFEPNHGNDPLRNIKVTNFVTRNNSGGILFATKELKTTEENGIDITIDNWTDNGSDFPLTFQTVVAKQHGGGIVINNATFIKPKRCAVFMTNYSVEAARVEINNVKVIDAFQEDTVIYGLYKAVFLHLRPSGFESTAPLMGNIHYNNPVIIDTRATKRDVFAFAFNDGAEQTCKWSNCTILNPGKIEILNPLKFLQTHNIDKHPLVADLYRSNVYDLGNTDLTVINQYSNASTYARYVHNRSSTALRTVTMSHLTPEATEITFEVLSANTIRIMPTTAWTLKPYGTQNQGLESNTVGSKITLVKQSIDGSWLIKEIVGAWKNSTTGRVVTGDSPETKVNNYTGSRTLTLDDSIIFATITGNSAYTLPSATICTGKKYKIKKVNTGAAELQINAASGELIDGMSFIILGNINQWVEIQSTGTGWETFSKYSVPTRPANQNLDYTNDIQSRFIVYSPTTNWTLILPDPVKFKSQPFYVKKANDNAFAITVSSPTGTIDGQLTKVINTAQQSVTFFSDGTNYWTI